MAFTVAIIGRPNVGKSTLFNRLVGKRLALVDDRPGVTRDRREGVGRIGALEFRVIDTAGLEEANDDSMEARMRAQTDAALWEAHMVLFMVDGQAGITPMDEHFAQWLREAERPSTVVVNKCEGSKGDAGYLEAFSLGLGDPIKLSAEHGDGRSDLFEVIDEAYEAYEAEHWHEEGEDDDLEGGETPLRLAIVGRPNVGKSTLINRLMGEDRLITGPEAGLTRDSIALRWEYKGQPVRLADTAGLRRKALVKDKLERLSAADTIRAIQFAEVVVVLVDATHPFEKQDLNIADRALQEGRAMVVAVNKWDLVDDPNKYQRELRHKLEEGLPQIKGVPIVMLSAMTGDKVGKLMPAVLRAHDIWNRRVSTARLNEWLRLMTEQHPPPISKGRRLRLRYLTQVKSRPPTFVCFTSKPDEFPASYIRYIVNGLREDFDMPGTPMRVLLRKPDNPYENVTSKKYKMSDTKKNKRDRQKKKGEGQ